MNMEFDLIQQMVRLNQTSLKVFPNCPKNATVRFPRLVCACRDNDSLHAAMAWFMPLPPGTSTKWSQLGKSVKVSPGEGKRAMGRKVSTFIEPATRMERGVSVAAVAWLVGERARKRRREARSMAMACGGAWEDEGCSLEHRRVMASRTSIFIFVSFELSKEGIS